MEDQGVRGAMAKSIVQVAMAGQGVREAMAEYTVQVAMADQGSSIPPPLLGETWRIISPGEHRRLIQSRGVPGVRELAATTAGVRELAVDGGSGLRRWMEP
ncbi:hypothetical protein M9458_052213 [Cirrhinus mrigala]|uniref:Uncharacterized protein n=1 Tax=Cirrhinus mrigala TaxID=683832 RepID=A0ABD0MU36_CIRMR